jgi:peptidoglycan/LPS O-acetylase OafA/YrhL
MLIKEKLQASDGRPSGFDYLRLILALCVVVTHSVQVDYGLSFALKYWLSWRRAIVAIILPMFFALSGFLVTGSMYRCNTLGSFLGLRVLRIAPALAVEVLLCAFILGPVFTTLSLPEYFAHPLFSRYFYNLIGNVQFLLPGVFDSNPYPHYVNEQLWAVPWELCCYILIAAMSLIGLFRHRSRIIILSLIFFVAASVLPSTRNPGFILVDGVILVESYLAGVVLFVFSDKLRYDWRLFTLSFIVTIVLLLIHRDYLVSFPAAYMTVYLGLLNPRRNKILLSGDYSYGIYLYGFPIQQAVACLNGVHRSWYLDMVYVLPLTVTVASASWWLIEKSALSLRKYVLAIDSLFRG